MSQTQMILKGANRSESPESIENNKRACPHYNINQVIFLSVEEVAGLTQESERTVQWKAQVGEYQAEYRETTARGGKSGKSLEIRLDSLKPAAQVEALRARGLLEAEKDDGWAGVSEGKRKIALERLRVVQGFEDFLRVCGMKKTEARRFFLASWTEAEISERTLRSWEKAYQEYGRVGLVPDYGKKVVKNQISPEAWNYFRQMWLKQQKRSVTDCYRDLLAAAEEYGWRVPSLRRMQQMAKTIPSAAVVLQREGPDAFLNTCQSSIRRDWSDVPANHCWMGDHHRLDFFVKNPNGRGTTRPWLTAWMDARSWKMVGWQLCFTPSTESILSSFRQGALDPAIGLPEMIYIDNGRDYASKEFAGTGHRTRKSRADDLRVQTTLETLNIGRIFAIPGNARAKTIERCFRIFCEQFSKRFDSYCGRNAQERPEQVEAIRKSGLVPTMDEVKVKLDAFVKLYNKTISQGKGREGLSPDEVFEQNRRSIRTVPASMLTLCLMRHTQPLTVRPGGIEFMKHWFNNPELIRYRDQKVYLRYDDRDLSQVEVFSLKDEWIMTAELVSALPALSATKEQIAEANRLWKRELEIARELGQVGMVESPLSPLDQLEFRAVRRSEEVADPKRPKIIEMVPIPRELKKAVGQMAGSHLESDLVDRIGKTMNFSSGEPKASKEINILDAIRNQKGD